MKQKLYTFNFISGGFNQVYAGSIVAAAVKADMEFGHLGIIAKSFKLVTDEKAYYDSFPLMD